ncbi:MAG TPA: cupredoxin domain-containing protein [Pyrinomonadaceae bacterium]|nr:cupredoxin domain-containing protein [Pyrinomonadaceae bacterium]
MPFKKSLLALSILVASAAAAHLPGPARARAAQPQGVGQVETVKITGQGINPETVMLRRKIPVRLTFLRETADTCATEIRVEELGINVALPLNQPVSVELTPERSGKFGFGCGTGKFRGVIVVR